MGNTIVQGTNLGSVSIMEVNAATAAARSNHQARRKMETVERS